MRRLWVIGVLMGMLSGCNDQEPFPVGIGSGRNELKRTICSDREKCKQEAFYRHGRYIRQ